MENTNSPAQAATRSSYDHQRAAIAKLVIELQNDLGCHDPKDTGHAVNYAHVGDLRYVREQLQAAVSFLGRSNDDKADEDAGEEPCAYCHCTGGHLNCNRPR